MIVVESAYILAHVVFSTPRLWNQHHHCVWQPAAALHQKLHHVVKACGVVLAFVDERHQLPDLFGAEKRAFEECLAGACMVQVSPEGVDFAVVCEIPEGMGQAPCREGVRAVALVHEHQRGDELLVRQVAVERLDLRGEHQSLVHNGTGAEAREICVKKLLLKTAAGDEDAAFQRLPRKPLLRGHEDLPYHRAAPAGDLAYARKVRRHVTPGKHPKPLLRKHTLQGRLLPYAVEEDANRIRARSGKYPADAPLEKAVGNHAQQAGTVAGQWVPPRRAAVQKTLQNRHATADNVVGGDAAQVRKHPDAAGVMLVAEMV